MDGRFNNLLVSIMISSIRPFDAPFLGPIAISRLSWILGLEGPHPPGRNWLDLCYRPTNHITVTSPEWTLAVITDLPELTRNRVPNLLVGRAVLASYRSASWVDVPQPDFLGVLSVPTHGLVDPEIPRRAVWQKK